MVFCPETAEKHGFMGNGRPIDPKGKGPPGPVNTDVRQRYARTSTLREDVNSYARTSTVTRGRQQLRKAKARAKLRLWARAKLRLWARAGLGLVPDVGLGLVPDAGLGLIPDAG